MKMLREIWDDQSDPKSVLKIIRVSIGPNNLRKLRISLKIASFLNPVMGVERSKYKECLVAAWRQF